MSVEDAEENVSETLVEQAINPTKRIRKPKAAKSAKPTKVLIAINTLTSIDAGVYRDHMMFFYRLGRDFPKIEFGQFVARRYAIDRFRNMAASLCIQGNFDYLMFVDDDMLFENPREVFGPLLKAGLDIISAFTYIRGYPFKIMSFKEVRRGAQRHLTNLEDKDLLQSNPKMRKDGVVMCDAIGTAVSLINVNIIRQVTAPWFVTGPRNTEDIYFCCKAKDTIKNIKIGMHTKVIIGHVLDPEAISHHTRESLKSYCESYMNPDEIQAANKSPLEQDRGDRGANYVEQEIESVIDTLNTDDAVGEHAIGDTNIGSADE